MELKDPLRGLQISLGSSNAPESTSFVRPMSTGEELVGKRVQIRAVKQIGSARLLDGLTGTVVAVHPIASGWVKLDLDENSRTPHRDWSVAADRLVLVASEPSQES